MDEGMTAAGVAAHVRWSVKRGERRSSKLTDEVMAIEGMSSPKVKCFLNNLCSAPWASYLEVGCWKGSTLCAAAYGNRPRRVLGIDNFSEAPEDQARGLRAEMHQNCIRFVTGRGVPFEFMAEDFREVDPFEIGGPFTVYFYDGAHDADAQRAAFTHMAPALADVFVAVVDDWNFRNARRGTWAAFQELGWGRVWEKELPANRNGDRRRWWNGLFVAVVDKRQADIRLMLAARGMGPDAVDRWMAAPIERLGSSLADAVADGRAELAKQTAMDLLGGRGGVRPPRRCT